MVKKLLFKVGLMLGGLFAVMLVLPGPDGKPLMQISELPGYGLFAATSEAVDSVGKAVEKTTENLQPPTEIYTWVDENGAVHYSDTPVAGSTVHEIADSNDAIPSENFTGEAYRPRQKEKPSFKSYLIKDSNHRGSKGDAKTLNPGEFDGDFTDTAALMQQLPEYLEKAHQARTEALR